MTHWPTGRPMSSVAQTPKSSSFCAGRWLRPAGSRATLGRCASRAGRGPRVLTECDGGSRAHDDLRCKRPRTRKTVPDGIRVAVFYTKLQARLLRPLLEANKPPAPVELRRALATVERVLTDYVTNGIAAEPPPGERSTDRQEWGTWSCTDPERPAHLRLRPWPGQTADRVRSCQPRPRTSGGQFL